MYCWLKTCHLLKPIWFSSACEVSYHWRSALLNPGNVSSEFFLNSFILVTPWKMSFVVEGEINTGTENISH